MRVLLAFTFIFLTALFYGLFSGGDFLPALEKMGGVVDYSSVGTVNASVVGSSMATGSVIVASITDSSLNKKDKFVKKIDSAVVSQKPRTCSIKPAIRTSKKKALKTPPKFKKIALNHWKDRKRKQIDMTMGQRKKLYRDVFSSLVIERLVNEGLVSTDILSRDSLEKERFIDTSEHMSALISLPAQESSYDPFIKCESSSASGFYQFTNGTGKKMCIELGIDTSFYDPYNPYQNITLGVHLYARSYKNFKRSVDWAIGVHHDGEGGVYDTNAIYGGIKKNPFVVSVRNKMKIKYKQYPQEAYEQWQEEVLSYNCLECIDYYSSLRDTVSEAVDTAIISTTPTVKDTAFDTILVPMVPKAKPLLASRTFF